MDMAWVLGGSGNKFKRSINQQKEEGLMTRQKLLDLIW
jgi:hypothetical protein